MAAWGLQPGSGAPPVRHVSVLCPDHSKEVLRAWAVTAADAVVDAADPTALGIETPEDGVRRAVKIRYLGSAEFGQSERGPPAAGHGAAGARPGRAVGGGAELRAAPGAEPRQPDRPLCQGVPDGPARGGGGAGARGAGQRSALAATPPRGERLRRPGLRAAESRAGGQRAGPPVSGMPSSGITPRRPLSSGGQDSARSATGRMQIRTRRGGRRTAEASAGRRGRARPRTRLRRGLLPRQTRVPQAGASGSAHGCSVLLARLRCERRYRQVLRRPEPTTPGVKRQQPDRKTGL